MVKVLQEATRSGGALLWRRPWLGVAFGVACVALIVWGVIADIGRTARERERAAAWELHTVQVQLQTQMLLAAVEAAETGQRGYLLTGDRRYLAPYEAGASVAQGRLDELQRLTQDNAAQQARLREVERLMRERLARLTLVLQRAESGSRGVAIVMMRDERNRLVMVQLRETLDAVWRSETALLAQRRAEARAAEAAARRSTLLGEGLAIALLAAFIASTIAAARAAQTARRRANDVEVSRRVQDQLQQRVDEALDEQRKTEAALRQAQKMEGVGQLAGGIAHDFNNMLAVIIGSLEMAQRRLASGQTDVGRYLNNATDGARRAASLTQRILAFSRQQPLEPKVLNVNRLVSDMSELLHRTLGAQVKLETVLASGLWTTKADANQLENVILNLAVNARDAMPNGGALTIETGNAHLDDAYARNHDSVKEGQYVFVAVTDAGGGMSKEVIEKAFEPFFTTKGVGKGTGLGLSQAFGFVKQSGGHIKIYSEIGQGTCVKVYLPRWMGDQATAETQRAEGAMPLGRSDDIILVVEDDEKVRAISVESLRELGYTVQHASNGVDALKVLEDNPGIALLFTDVVMPDMNGRELAKEAVSRRETLKVLFTTGYTRNSIVHNGVLDADVAFLAKPFSLDQLARKVRAVLDATAPP